MAIDTKQMIKELVSLVHLDIDAVHAYDAAISNVDVVSIREGLVQFRADHERHISEISQVLRRLNEEPPKLTPDFKGFLLQGMTAIRSATGTEGALKAMKMNEELTNKTYGSKVKLDVPDDVKAVLQRGFADEQRHLRSIEQWINARAWEGAGAHV